MCIVRFLHLFCLEFDHQVIDIRHSIEAAAVVRVAVSAL
jgi:hypothetical protein